MTQYELEIAKEKSLLAKWVSIGLFIAGLFFLLSLAGCPHYSVWQNEMSGKAEYARAEQNRRIAVTEAQAKLDAAKLTNQAEIERAKGLAEANKLIGDSLKGNEAYLRYLWIDSIKSNNANIIYVPTEAGLPILEAGRSNLN